MCTVKMVIDDRLQTGLRALRLHHWNECLTHRENAVYHRKIKYEDIAKWFDGQADFHIKQVQLLNEFFEIGDTAERDASAIADAPPG